MYTLTFPNGVVLEFYLRSCAEIYQQAHSGGKLGFNSSLPHSYKASRRTVAG